MKLPQIVGIAGTNASGKDTLGLLRSQLQGVKMVSLSDILRAELDRRGVAHERENLRALSSEWRTVGGEGVMAAKTIMQYRLDKDTKGISIVSLRKPEEVEEIQKAGGIVIWIDADRKLRYQRIQARQKALGRPEDMKTYDEFVMEEEAEMDPSRNEAGLNMSGVRAKADLFITNDFATEKQYIDYLIKEFELN